jgi:hypothetical protein
MKKLISILLIGAAFTSVPAISAPRAVKNFTPGTRATVLLFVASMCPCTDAHREMVRNLVAEAEGSGINFYCVFSNQGETRSLVDHFFKQIGWDMPFVLDSQGKLADRFGATNTPEAVVLDAMQQVVFRGPIDDSNRNLGRVTKPYLKDALNDVRAGQAVQVAEVQPTGCYIVTKNGVKMPAGL